MIYVVLFIVALVIVFVSIQIKNQKERDRITKENAERIRLEEEKKRKELNNFFKSKLGIITKGNFNFNQLTSYDNGYFNNFKMLSWKLKYTPTYNAIYSKDYKNISLESDEIESIETFINNAANIETKREIHNKFFIEEELKKFDVFFNNIENRKLDIQQRTAIVKDEDNNLIIAGAGSGKTTTIVGKVNYILEKNLAKPDEILLISFTNESARTLANRISNPNVEAKTFHKFGIDVINSVERRAPSIFDTLQFENIIKGFFNQLIINVNYLEKVTTFFINYLKPVVDDNTFNNQGEHIQFLKDNNYRSYQFDNARQTYRMEIVKSIQECQIANFLLFNGIEYKYEFPYEIDTATPIHHRWKPDFTLTQNGKKIYYEHFGIDRYGANSDYIDHPIPI